MDSSSLLLALIAIAISVIIHLTTRSKNPRPTRLPPGSLGLPVIGKSLGFLRNMRANTIERWIQDQVDRYGPVFKCSLFGTPTVFLTGPAANKFVFFNSALAMRQPRYVQRILGDKSILDLNGADHKRIRGALAEFLKPDMLRLYVGKIEVEVRRHLDEQWAGRATVAVMPLMKRLTFNVISLLLFGLTLGPRHDAFAADFARVVKGMSSLPVNLPFTAFGRSLKASASARRVFREITRETKGKLERGEATRSSDLIACMLSLIDEHGARVLSEEEIIDNAIASFIAGYETTSVLLTFMVRQLAKNPDTMAAMVQEHDDIAKGKLDGEALTWEDLAKMKFTWRVAQETLRVVPPAFGNLKTAVRDVEFDGYTIPKGWQVFWVAGVTHMDAAIFPDPEKFDPSRFDNQSVPPCSFVAFGAGPRICVGMEFVRIETLVTMHHLVRRFRWRLRCKDDTFIRDPLPSPPGGLPVDIEERNCT